MSPKLAQALEQLAAREPNVEVRSQLACSTRRLPAEQSLPVIAKLLSHDEDIHDPHLPLLLWWAMESKADSDRDLVIGLLVAPESWRRPLVHAQIVEQLMRRYAQSGTQKDLLSCARLLELAPTDVDVKLLMAGFEKAYEGRSLTGLPEQLVTIMSKRGGGSLALRLRQSDPEAILESLRIVTDEKMKKSERIQYVQVLGQIHPAGGIEPLLALLENSKDSDIRTTALTALQGYDAPRIGEKIVSMVGSFANETRSVALSLLASRTTWTRSLLAAVEAESIKPDEVPPEIVARMALHEDATSRRSIEKHWSKMSGANNEEMRKKIAELTGSLASGTGNPYRGKISYKASCGKCHRLFEEGGLIGPDLTQYKRDDVTTMLVNVVNPSLQIREGFEAFHVLTNDGLVLNGFISDQDNQIVVLRTADGQTIVIPRDDIESMKASPISIMPAGLLDGLDEQQVRDLFAYLRATQPLN